MADLNDLLAALAKVASPYDGEDEDDDLDREVGEDADGADEDDFSRRQPAVMRLAKATDRVKSLNTVHGKDGVKLCNLHKSLKPITKAEANIKKISELRQKTDAARFELETNKQLAEQTKLYEDARLALYRSNLTPAQKWEQEQDAYRMGMWASQYCAEASPNWREEAQAAFNAKNLPRIGK